MLKKKYSIEDIDELRKSLTDLEFSNDEINEIISKAEDEEVEVEDEEEKEENNKSEEMSKAYTDIMKMKTDLDKAMDSFLDRFGNVPGFKKPDFDVKNKSVEVDIEKSEKEDIMKGIMDNFSSIQDTINSQKEFNDEIKKSLESISETVQKIAEAPNPFKALLGNYSNSIIQKGESVDSEGKTIINVRNKKAVQDILLKSLDKITEEDHKTAVRDEISNFTVTNKLNPKTLDIVKKAMNVEFEK